MKSKKVGFVDASQGGIIVAGGGTAGHLLPGLAVADELVKRGWPREAVLFVGSSRGVELEMVPAAGYGLVALSGRGLNGRRVSPRNLLNLVAIIWAIFRGSWIVKRRRPGVVLSLGGYAALPAGIGAIVFRVPLVLAEQNTAASAANRLMTKFAKAAAVPCAGTGLKNEVITGNPVRQAVLRADREGRSLRNELGWPTDKPAVVVFGGSLGSRRINQAVWEAVKVGDLPFIHHVVGRRDWQALPKSLPSNVMAYAYDDDLPNAMAASDLVVCRPGGSSVAEIALLGLPAVLVPLPNAPNDHQSRNAQYLVDSGLAVSVPDEEFDGQRFRDEIERMLTRFQSESDPDLARRGRSVGYRDAAERVADLVMKHCLAPYGQSDRKGEAL
ncbi:MAG: UDP-N-acetylglucosamine--N-acetylmuramyl-(pentapeptide) pyrophosphoryl-undecaprenol N-acetylglucosamine transferase [Actinomycetota bacterium]|nr:UDP-N-acetylglucosamine--N-acetylmuramyl-(pentapeptide) pyrophosphoryl-undecaprenol N-acetylglucosamine transferase [Actinomycetota bacterium]|tara:strand:- start:2574 stop:3728 length:1155 start_codon:yes stop_codon:yes gene_type:complete